MFVSDAPANAAVCFERARALYRNARNKSGQCSAVRRLALLHEDSAHYHKAFSHTHAYTHNTQAQKELLQLEEELLVQVASEGVDGSEKAQQAGSHRRGHCSGGDDTPAHGTGRGCAGNV